MKKFIKLQFYRSCNIIKTIWELLVFYFIDKIWFIPTFCKNIMRCIMGIISLILIIGFLIMFPLILIMFEHDERIGF